MKELFVEGITDKYVIERLLKRRKIQFGQFEINIGNNVENVLRILPTTIKLKGNEDTIGVIVDADEDLIGRWRSLEAILKKAGYDNIPQQLPAKGLILKDEEDLPRIGMWLMPDNTLEGRIEDFMDLRYLLCLI